MQLNSKEITTKNIYGNWLYKNNFIKISILITESEVNLYINDDKPINFKSNYEWIDDFLIFSYAKRKYFIKNANNKTLKFGSFKISANINLAVEWEFTFNRIKH